MLVEIGLEEKDYWNLKNLVVVLRATWRINITNKKDHWIIRTHASDIMENKLI
jgi:hypothetical protein